MKSQHERLHREPRAYCGGADRPLAACTGLMGVYAAAVLGICAARATHQLGPLIAKDPGTSPLRAPFTHFTTFQGTSGPAEPEEEVRGTGARKAIGMPVRWPFCTGLWIATGFTAGSVFAPRATRLAAASLAAADFLQFAQVAAQHACGETP
jgi:hypothetical protein